MRVDSRHRDHFLTPERADRRQVALNLTTTVDSRFRRPYFWARPPRAGGGCSGSGSISGVFSASGLSTIHCDATLGRRRCHGSHDPHPRGRLPSHRLPRDCGGPPDVRHVSRHAPPSAKLIHGRWSGEACWVPFGDHELDLGYENHTSHPAPGHLLLYPGGMSETEILLPYGATVFASKVGQLAGNHFATVQDGQEHLAELGKRVLWEGAQDITFEAR